jgi:uncharacterized protein
MEIIKMTQADNRAIDANNLCKKCGICCDGTLFGHVVIPPSDVLKTKKLGIPFSKNSDGDFIFQQGCPRFVNLSCEVYSERPHACIEYACKLQKEVKNGTIKYEDGLKIVEQVKEYTAWVRATLVSESPSNTKPINYRQILIDYHLIATLQNSRGELSEADAICIKRVYEQTKLMDHFFQGSNFPKIYKELIDSIKK